MTLFQKIVLAAAVVMAAVIFAAAPGMAIQPDEVLDDPILESRAREISKDIRCLVCQNQSIDDSDADLARDLRIIIRERLVEGDTDKAVKTYLVERYGNYVLLTPPMSVGTLLLWGGPFLLVLLGLLAIIIWYRGRKDDGPGPKLDGLSASEQKRLDEILAADNTGQESKS